MVFTKLMLENALAIRPCNYKAALELLLPKVASCIPVLSSCYTGKCAAHVLTRSAQSEAKTSNIPHQLYANYFGISFQFIASRDRCTPSGNRSKGVKNEMSISIAVAAGA